MLHHQYQDWRIRQRHILICKQVASSVYCHSEDAHHAVQTWLWTSSCGSGSGLLWWLVDFNMRFILGKGGGGRQPCCCLVFYINLKAVDWIHSPSDVLEEHIISDFIQVQITQILPRCHNRQLQTQDSSLELPVTDADALGLPENTVATHETLNTECGNHASASCLWASIRERRLLNIDAKLQMFGNS